MPSGKLCISSDSHIVETPEIFEGLGERFGDAAPSIVDTERGPTLSLGGGERYLPVGIFGIAGHFLNDPKTQELVRQGYAGLRPGVIDPVERLKDQDLDGLDAEILLPSALFGVYGISNPEIVAATFKSYNDWLSNYASQAPGRLFPTACIPLHDVDKGVAELRRAVKRGHVGANIPCTPPADRPYSEHYYDPFWAVAEELGVPLIMHIFTSAQTNHGMPDVGPVLNYGSVAFAIQKVIGDLICSGVCARFPGLKFVPTEWETGWVAHFLQRMDWAVIRARAGVVAEEMTEPFSHYFRQNFLVTFEDDRIGLETRYDIGIENLMWGSDYPHQDSVFPRSQLILDEIFEDIPDEERHLITAGNVTRIYGLPFEA